MSRKKFMRRRKKERNQGEKKYGKAKNTKESVKVKKNN